MNAKETKLRYLVNFIAVAALFAAAVALGLTGGDTMKLRITPSIWQCGYLIVMAASLNLVLGFLGQGVDNFAHLGGLAGGYLLALGAGLYGEHTSPAHRALGLAGALALWAGLLALGHMGLMRFF